MDVIAVKGLSKRYGSKAAVVDLSFAVPPGTLFGFLGPNGSGKTTTIRILLGFMKSTSGQAQVFQRDAWRESSGIKADVGYMPGDIRLYSWVNANIALGMFGRSRRRDLTQEGKRLVELFDLDPTVRVRNMSRGMRQKLGIILALAHQPSLLILDEASSSLDPLMQVRLYEELRRRSNAGCTVFLSSHTLSEVEELCDQVVILREGSLVANESIESLRSRAKRRVTLQWKESMAATAVPPFLEIVERTNTKWSGLLVGSASDFVRWCATGPIEDVSIAPPDLAALFQEFYR